MQIKVKKITNRAVIPTKGTQASAGYDLYSCDKGGIMPGQTCVFGTGLAMEIPEGYFGGIFARSGMATKRGLRPATCVSVIDADYRNEIKVGIHNDSNEPEVIAEGDRIAQLIILPCPDIDFVEVEELSDTERGMGGFGSTGK